MIIDWKEKGDFIPELQAVLKAIAGTLHGRRPLPSLIIENMDAYHGIIPGHYVGIEHRPRPPKGTRPRLYAQYIITISGSRIDGRWAFTPGQLEKAIAKVS